MLVVVAVGLLPLLPTASHRDLARGEALAQAQQFDEAVRVLLHVIDDCAATDDEVARAYLTLGWAESSLGREDDARRSFAEALLVDKSLALPDKASEESRALLETVRREGAKPWGPGKRGLADSGAGRLVAESVPSVPVEIDGERHATPAEVGAPYDHVVFLANPPFRVEVGCRRLGTTRVTAFMAETMRARDNANTALVATGATLAGMGAVVGIVSLAVYDAQDPKASLVTGIVGGSLVVAGAIPLAIAGIRHASAPPISHMVRVQPPGADEYRVMFDPKTGARVP